MTALFFVLQEKGIFVYVQNKKIYTIDISMNGFSPDELTIHQYDSVRFVNTDPKFPHSPASDPHPTHDLYPQFDAVNVIVPQQSWTFQFDRIGEWHYHDHIFPYLTGEIMVLP